MKKLSLIISLLITLSAFGRTSEEIRADKNFEVLYKVGYDYRMATNQVGASYFFNANHILGARVGAAKDGGERQTNVSLEYKYFLSNSFYVAPEIFYLNTVEDEWWLSSLFRIDYTRYTSMGAGVRIGNQWSWEYVSFGVDWFGIGQRVGTFHRDYTSITKNTFTLLNLTLSAHF